MILRQHGPGRVPDLTDILKIRLLDGQHCVLSQPAMTMSTTLLPSAVVHSASMIFP